MRALSRLSTLALLLLSSNASATVVRPLSLADLVSRSDRIAIVRVSSQKAEWTADRSAIYTKILVTVVQPVKGGMARGQRLTILREGGEVGEVGMLVEGAPRFADGEEALVFLEQRGQSTWTVGMAQGKLGVRSAGGKRWVAPDLRDLRLASAQSAQAVAPQARLLDDVLRDIAHLLTSGESRR